MSKLNNAPAGTITRTPSSNPVVSLAFLQSAITVPSRVNTESTLSSEKVRGLKRMEWTPDGLILHFDGQRAIIPLANVKVAIFED